AFIRRHLSPKQSTRRLAVDRLEDRMVPAAFTVNSLLDTANPPSGVTTFRSAITAANADNNTDPLHPDVIVFTVAGKISLASVLPSISGDLFVQGPGAGNLTVLGPPSFNGNVTRGVFSVGSTGAATLSGLTLDGNAAN